jgi:hypothetical protein
VPRGTERLRITATPYHDDVLIDQLAEALRIDGRGSVSSYLYRCSKRLLTVP